MDNKRHKSEEVKVAVKAHPDSYQLIMMAIFFVVLMIFSLAFSSLAKASSEFDLKDLETRIWTAEDSQLPEIEREVIRELQKKPGSVYVHYLLSHLSIRLLSQDMSDVRYLEQASFLAQQAVELNPRLEYGYLSLAEALDLTGNPEKGIRLLSEAINAGVKTTWRTQFTLARLGANSLDPKEVLKILKRSMDAEHSNHDIVVPYVIAFLQSHHPQNQLVDVLDRWHSEYQHGLFRQVSAIVYTQLGQYQKAHEIYQDIFTKDSENRESIINDAIIQYRHLNKTKLAIEMFSTVNRRFGKQMSANSISVVNAHLATAYLNEGNDRAAEKAYIIAMQHSSDYNKTLKFVNQSYKNLKKERQFVGFLRKLNFEAPGRAVAHAMLGETLSESLKDHLSAIESFKDAIALDPSRADFYTAMGLTYYRMEDFNEALQLFKTARLLDPTDATAVYNEACMLAKLGRNEDALNSLDRAIALEPNLQKTAKEDLDFASLRSHNRFHLITHKPIKEAGNVSH